MPDPKRTNELRPEHDAILNQVRDALRKIAPDIPAFTVMILDESEDRYAIASTSNMGLDEQKEILSICLDALSTRLPKTQH